MPLFDVELDTHTKDYGHKDLIYKDYEKPKMKLFPKYKVDYALENSKVSGGKDE